MTSRVRNHCNIPNQYLCNTRSEKTRKNCQYPPKGDCTQEIFTNEARYRDTRNYPSLDSPVDNDQFKVGDETVNSNADTLSFGETSIADPDANGDIEHDYPDITLDYKQREKYMQDVTYSTYPNNKRASNNYGIDDPEPDLTLRSNLQRKTQDYSDKKGLYEPSSDPHALMVMRRLQRIKDLERKRDFSEKYYTQEIRRLIGDQFFDVKPIPQPIYRHQDKKLESCGTMTTITRLNCGCMEETTRPIFTTPKGQVVQKSSCGQKQQVHMKLSVPNVRITNHPQPVSLTPKLKSKSYNADTRGANITGNNTTKDVTSAGRSSSPTRKCSESSVFSA